MAMSAPGSEPKCRLELLTSAKLSILEVSLGFFCPLKRANIAKSRDWMQWPSTFDVVVDQKAVSSFSEG